MSHRLALIGLLVALLPMPFPALAEDRVVAATDTFERVARQDAVLIDIRQPEEWRQTGMAQDAVGISMQQPGGARAFLDAVLDAVDGDMQAPIVLICRTGNRTSQVVRAMREWGFDNVQHVAEGMLGSQYGAGWIATGLPVEECRVC